MNCFDISERIIGLFELNMIEYVKNEKEGDYKCVAQEVKTDGHYFC